MYKYKSKGYIRMWIPEEKRLVLEHRYVVEKHLNRELSLDEIVHHKDGNKSNNNIENLQVMIDAEHRRSHLIGNKRECTTKYEIVYEIPGTNHAVGATISLLPNYRSMELVQCICCGTKFWRRRDKKSRSCSPRCSTKTAWKEGKFEKRRSKNTD